MATKYVANAKVAAQSNSARRDRPLPILPADREDPGQKCCPVWKQPRGRRRMGTWRMSNMQEMRKGHDRNDLAQSRESDAQSYQTHSPSELKQSFW